MSFVLSVSFLPFKYERNKVAIAMDGTPTEMAVWSLMSLSAVLWAAFIIGDFNPFSLFGSTEVKTMVATLFGLLGVYDLGATFGLVEYP